MVRRKVKLLTRVTMEDFARAGPVEFIDYWSVVPDTDSRSITAYTVVTPTNKVSVAVVCQRTPTVFGDWRRPQDVAARA